MPVRSDGLYAKKTLTRLVREMVLESEHSAKQVAKQIGKPYSTLLRELNLFDNGAKLGAETLLEIMKVTGDMQPLEFMARELGFGLVRHEDA